jgi:hypothetical protein
LHLNDIGLSATEWRIHAPGTNRSTMQQPLG